MGPRSAGTSAGRRRVGGYQVLSRPHHSRPAQGAEANTIIPHRATVAIDIRMVKNQTRKKVYGRLLEHIRAQGFTVLESADDPLPDDLRGRTVRVLDANGYDPGKTALDLPVSREIIAAVERAHPGERVVLRPTLAGSGA